MKTSEFHSLIKTILPQADIAQDQSGEIIIHTACYAFPDDPHTVVNEEGEECLNTLIIEPQKKGEKKWDVTQISNFHRRPLSQMSAKS